MNITFFLREFPKASETFIRSQVEGLIACGHRVSILSLRKPPVSVPAGIPDGLAAIRYAGLSGNTLKNTTTAIKSLACVLTTRTIAQLPNVRSLDDLVLLPHLITPMFAEADAVIIHFGDLAYRYAILAGRFGLHAPFAGVFHGVDVARYLPSLNPSERDLLWRRMTLGLPVSEYWRDSLVSLGCPANKLTVHHMGIDPDRFRPRNEPRGDKPFSLVSVCRLVEKKGIDTVLHALARIVDPQPVMYHIIGDGPERERLESLTRTLGLTETVRFHGTLSPDNIAEFLAHTDAFVLASRTAANGDMEGIPVSLMEAMACGLPVVSTRHSGIPELIKDGVSGLLADENDSAGIAAAIHRLMEDRTLGVSLGKAARVSVTRSFNSTILATEFETILSNMITSATGYSAENTR